MKSVCLGSSMQLRPCQKVGSRSRVRGPRAPGAWAKPQRQLQHAGQQFTCHHVAWRASRVQTLAATTQEGAETVEEQLGSLVVEQETAAGRVVVRVVSPQDVMGACVVLTRAFTGTPEEIGLNDAKRYVDNVVNKPSGGALFVARIIPNDKSLLPPNQESRLIGTVALSLREDTLQQIPTLPPPPNTAYLSNMAVDVKFRRMGVARALMQVCDQAVQASGLNEIYLHVRQGDEPAYNLYASAGYADVARDSFLAAKLKNVRPRILMRKSV